MFASNPAVTHNFLNKTNGLSCVCFIKEQYGINFVPAVLDDFLFHFLNHINNILLSCPSMNLHITMAKLFQYTVN